MNPKEKKTPMKKRPALFIRHLLIPLLLFCPATILPPLAGQVLASDTIIKYYIFSMKTPADRDKVVSIISKFEGVNEVDTRLERHWVYVYFDDDLLQDERFEVRKLLKKQGYPVDRWEMQLEKPDSQE